MGLFVAEYSFDSGRSPSFGDVLARLSERSGLKATSRKWSSVVGSRGFVLSKLREGASIRLTSSSCYVEYDEFPPSVFLLSHLDATFRDLGGVDARDGAQKSASRAVAKWDQLGFWERAIYRSRLVRFVAFALGSMSSRPKARPSA